MKQLQIPFGLIENKDIIIFSLSVCPLPADITSFLVPRGREGHTGTRQGTSTMRPLQTLELNSGFYLITWRLQLIYFILYHVISFLNSRLFLFSGSCGSEGQKIEIVQIYLNALKIHLYYRCMCIKGVTNAADDARFSKGLNNHRTHLCVWASGCKVASCTFCFMIFFYNKVWSYNFVSH